MSVFRAIKSIFTRKAYRIVGLDITKLKMWRLRVG